MRGRSGSGMSHWDLKPWGGARCQDLGKANHSKGKFPGHQFPTWRENCQVATVGLIVFQLSLQRPLHLQVLPHSLQKALDPAGTLPHI